MYLNKQLLKNFLKNILPKKIYSCLATFLYAFRQIRAVIINRYFFYIYKIGYHSKFLYPKFLSIFLTTRCNLRCFICEREQFKGTDLKFYNIFKLETPIKHAKIIDLTGWGECLLYPHFKEVIEYIYSLNTSSNLIRITSNGTMISSKTAELLTGHLNSAVISVNAANANTYTRDMKNGTFEKVIHNILDFKKGLTPAEQNKISLHFVAHINNFHELPDFITLAKELGIKNITIGQYLIRNPEKKNHTLVNIKHEYNSILEKADLLAKQHQITMSARYFFREQPFQLKKCMEPFYACFIEPDGQIAPCCHSGNYRIGNVYETDFESVWFGDKYNNLRRKRDLITCRQCSPFIPFDNPYAHTTGHFRENNYSMDL